MFSQITHVVFEIMCFNFRKMIVCYIKSPLLCRKSVFYIWNSHPLSKILTIIRFTIHSFFHKHTEILRPLLPSVMDNTQIHFSSMCQLMGYMQRPSRLGRWGIHLNHPQSSLSRLYSLSVYTHYARGDMGRRHPLRLRARLVR